MRKKQGIPRYSKGFYPECEECKKWICDKHKSILCKLLLESMLRNESQPI